MQKKILSPDLTSSESFQAIVLLTVILAGCGGPVNTAEPKVEKGALLSALMRSADSARKHSAGSAAGHVSAGVAADALSLSAPVDGSSVSGSVQLQGIAGSQWVNVAAYNANGLKVAPDASPSNGGFTLVLDSSLLKDGPESVAVMAFSVPAGEGGGTSATLMLSLNVNNSAPAPTSTPTATATPTPTPTPTSTAQPPAAPSGATHCANENEFCSFNGTQTVRYGANGVYFTRTFKDGVSCSNSVFGDPLVGTYKSCDLMGSEVTPPAPEPSPTSTPAPTSTPTPTSSPTAVPTSQPTSQPTSKPTPPPVSDGWLMTFDDEFDGSSLDASKWGNTLGGQRTLAGNAELECYLENNVQVANGSLELIAKKETVNCPGLGTYNYTSGAVGTWTTFTQKYGYYEMSVNLPKGQGFWPAFWLLAADGSWPPEIDIFEVLNSSTNVDNQTLHWLNSDGSQGGLMNSPTVSDLAVGFHKIGLDWEPGVMTWYVDGVQTSQQSGSMIPDKAMFILINLAVGGSWPGNPDGSTQFPSTMSVDYVRVYQKIGNGPANGLPPGY